MEQEKSQNSQSNLEKENQSRKHHNPGLQALLQSCNHQDSMVLAQKHSDQWTRLENPELDPHMCGQLVSLANGVGRTGQQHAEEGTWTTFLHHTQK